MRAPAFRLLSPRAARRSTEPPEQCSYRLSLSCDRDAAETRDAPVRALSCKKVYLGAIVILISAIPRPTLRRVGELSRLFGVDAATITRGRRSGVTTSPRRRFGESLAPVSCGCRVHGCAAATSWRRFAAPTTSTAIGCGSCGFSHRSVAARRRARYSMVDDTREDARLGAPMNGRIVFNEGSRILQKQRKFPRKKPDRVRRCDRKAVRCPQDCGRAACRAATPAPRNPAK